MGGEQPVNANLKQGIWTILGFLLMLALMIPVGIGYDQWRRANRPKPQLGRYEIVASGSAETVVKLDTATGRAWILRDLTDAQKWAPVAEDTDTVWRYVPTADGKGKLVPDPLGIRVPEKP